MLHRVKQLCGKALQHSSSISAKGSLNLFQQNFSSQNSNAKRLQDKVAVITASTDGIGFSIAKRLAAEGAKVVISSRKQANVDKAVEELRKLNFNVLGLKCHVGEAQDRKQLFEETIRQFGKVNILVSNAAVNPADGEILDCDEKVWDKIFDINLKSSYLLAKEALPHLRKEKNSNIVFVSSIAAYGTYGFQKLGTYSVSKIALIGLTKEIAYNLGHEGIRVNCLVPGIIKTKFSRVFYPNEAAKRYTLSRIPLQRFGMPEEMAAAVSFLVSDESSYITGEAIVAAGGMASHI